MPPSINPRWSEGSQSLSLCPRVSLDGATVCVSSPSLFPVMYQPCLRRHGCYVRSLATVHPFPLPPVLRIGRPHLPAHVPSLTGMGTYLQSHETHGPFALQPLCMIIENPGDTSQPRSRVIYYYFVSITSEMAGEGGGGWMDFSATVGNDSMSYADWYTYTDGFFGASPTTRISRTCVLDGIKRKRLASPITFRGPSRWWLMKMEIRCERH